MSELTTIDGIGDKKAQQLEDNGIESVAELAGEDISSLTSIDGVGETTATDLVEKAEAELEEEAGPWNGIETVMVLAQEGFEDDSTKNAVLRVEAAIQSSPYAPRRVVRAGNGMYGGPEVQEWASMRALHADDAIEVETVWGDWDDDADPGEVIGERDEQIADEVDAVVVVEDGEYLEFTLDRFTEASCEVFRHIDDEPTSPEWEPLAHEGGRNKVAVVAGEGKFSLLDEEKSVRVVTDALDEAGLVPEVVGMQNNMDDEPDPVERWLDTIEADVSERVFHAPWDQFTQAQNGQAPKLRDIAMAEWADDLIIVRPGEYSDMLLDRADTRGTTCWQYTLQDGVEKNPDYRVYESNDDSSSRVSKTDQVANQEEDDVDTYSDDPHTPAGVMDDRDGWEDHMDGEGAGSAGEFLSN